MIPTEITFFAYGMAAGMTLMTIYLGGKLYSCHKRLKAQQHALTTAKNTIHNQATALRNQMERANRQMLTPPRMLRQAEQE